MDGGDGCTIMKMYLVSLNCTLKNGSNGRFNVTSILPQFFKVLRRGRALEPEHRSGRDGLHSGNREEGNLSERYWIQQQ